MSKKLLTEIVAELEVLKGLLEIRAHRLRSAATLLYEIEEILEQAAVSSVPAEQIEISVPMESEDTDWSAGRPCQVPESGRQGDS